MNPSSYWTPEELAHAYMVVHFTDGSPKVAQNIFQDRSSAQQWVDLFRSDGIRSYLIPATRAQIDAAPILLG